MRISRDATGSGGGRCGGLERRCSLLELVSKGISSPSLRQVRVLGTELHLLTSFGRHDTPLDISKLTLLRIDFGLEQQALGLHVLGQAKAGQVGS